MKKALLILSLFIGNKLLAQHISGSWYGQADVEIAGVHSNYLTELIIKQKGDRIEGIFGYYFKDVHQSFFVRGTYNPQTQAILIKNIPIIYFNTNSTVNSIDCNADFEGTLFVSKVKKSINGYFIHDGKYKYTCPDLRVTYTLDIEDKEQDSVLKNTVAGKKFWKPQPDDFIVSSTETKKTPAVPPKTDPKDSSVAKMMDTAVVVTPVKGNADIKKIEESFTKRKPVVNKELLVESDSVELSFYDNGDIDGDSISVFLNKQVVLTHQGLTAKAINLYVKLDSLVDVNEISMFAENLGRIPPNTALMVVTDGVNRYEVFMSSSFKQNSVVRLKRKK